MKTSQQQFELMVTFMEQNGDLNKPSTSARGRMGAIMHWEDLTSLLNSDGSGDTKSTEKWKKVWSDFKNNAKRKAARLHRAAKGTGGGPAVHAKLSDLEQRVLNLIGIQAATGLPVEEAGFSQELHIEARVPDPAPIGQPISSPIPEIFRNITEEQTEPWNEPGPSSRTHLPPPPPLAEPTASSYVGDEIIENTATPPRRPPQSHVAVSEPQAQPSQSGQSTPRRSARVTRNRRSPRRRVRPAHTEQAAQQFLHSDIEWRNFRKQQHRDYMDAKREHNRIREMEVEVQREWQAVALRGLGLLDKLVNKYCKE